MPIFVDCLWRTRKNGPMVEIGASDPDVRSDATPSLEAWVEWQERCALALCAQPTQQKLRAFGAARFAHYVRHYVGQTNAGDPGACERNPENIWHLFETHLSLNGTRQGKAYKLWLFARIESATKDRPIDIIQGGATLLMRDVVREYLRREFSPREMVSTETPAGGGPAEGQSLTLEDMLPGTPDPTPDLERREFERLAERHGFMIFRNMGHRERVASLAKKVGLSLAHPDVTRCAGCNKSVLNDTFRRFVERTAKHLQSEYREDGRDAVLTITVMSLDAAWNLVAEWAASQQECVPLFDSARALAVESE